MKIHSILLTLSIFAVSPMSAATLRWSEPQASEEGEAVTIKGITKEQAIVIARRHALKNYKSLKSFRVMSCELTIFWRIIFDGGGPEYVVDKRSGAIRRVQMIRETWSSVETGPSVKQPPITKDAAIEIARRDAIDSVPGNSEDHFIVFACELKKVWRVFVEYKLVFGPTGKDPVLPYSSTPNYVIDKRTGKILFKQR